MMYFNVYMMIMIIMIIIININFSGPMSMTKNAFNVPGITYSVHIRHISTSCHDVFGCVNKINIQLVLLLLLLLLLLNCIIKFHLFQFIEILHKIIYWLKVGGHKHTIAPLPPQIKTGGAHATPLPMPVDIFRMRQC